MSTPRVIYFGIFDPDYPRNQRIREYLEAEFGAKINIVRGEAEGGQ